MGELSDIPPGTYTLELGQSFSDSRDASYSTLRYDFKPQSVAGAGTSETFIAFGDKGEVHVTVPLDDEKMQVFKGSNRDAKPKECLLFFDKATGQMRLEKISSNINVKKTRDVDKNTEKVLRSEMERLRAAQPATRSSALVPPLSAPTAPVVPGPSHAVSGGSFPREESSSESSSSDDDSDSDSASDSGSDEGQNAKKNRDRDSNSDMNMSDMELENDLLANMDAPVAPCKPPEARDDSMPNFTSSPAQNRSSLSHKKPSDHGALGLALSESSDDDD